MISDFIAALTTFFTEENSRNTGRCPSTISREVRINRLNKGNYFPKIAQQRTLQRRHGSKKGRIIQNTLIAVEFMLELDWSPEQIAAICKRLGLFASHKWIYGHALPDFKQGGGLYLHLRHRLKCYKKRFHKQRGRVLGRHSIHQRLEVINRRTRYGDGEVVAVIDKHRAGVIVTILGCKNRFYVTKKIASKNASEVATVLVEMLIPYQPLGRTIAADNCLEFTKHQRVAKELQADI